MQRHPSASGNLTGALPTPVNPAILKARRLPPIMHTPMNTSSPFAFPFKLPTGPMDLPSWMQPPPWLVAEIQQRIVLLLNHVLQQEPEAMERLARQKGRIASVECAPIAIKLVATPAGLLDIAAPDAKADLTMTVLDSNPFILVQTVLSGKKPDLRIEGDIQLAAEVNWLVDHVRWDAEEDLSRIMGDAPAHSLVKVLGQAVDALKKFAPSGAKAHNTTSAHSASQG